jgi:hypothetical protein
MSVHNHSLRLGAASLLAMLLGSYVFATDAAAEEYGDISRINQGITIESQERVGDVSSVNGGIQLSDGSVAGKVSTVNGSIEIDDNVSVRSAHTVNGGIRVGRETSIDGDLETVNGGISTEAGTEVAASIETVNGRIRLRGSRVGENVETSNGDIDVLDDSVIEGDVIVRGRRHWWDRFFNFYTNEPELTIDSTSTVHGDIHLYQEVELNVADGSVRGEIIEHF